MTRDPLQTEARIPGNRNSKPAVTEYFAPTHIYFGRGAEDLVGEVLKENGAKKILLHYGGSSAEKSGLLDKVRGRLDAVDIEYTELGGVQPNPRLSLARRGISICKEKNIDFILAVGGGSVLDSAKCIAYGAVYSGDVWDFYKGLLKPSARLPMGSILTLAATGSEMSDSSVMTNDEVSPADKFGCNSNLGRPAFALLNPELTFSVPAYQTGSGSADIIMHTLERFFYKGPVLDLTDELSAALIRRVADSTHKALEKPDDYEARANLMWAASLSHNGMFNMGHNTIGDWACHRLEHELSALFDVAHGAGLAAIWSSWARYVMNENPGRFARLGDLLFGKEEERARSEADIRAKATETIDRIEKIFESFKMPVRISGLDIDATDEVCRTLAEKASLNGRKTLGNFKILKTEDMYNIFKMAAK